MAATFRSANSSSATTNSHGFTAPAGIASGDILILSVGTDTIAAVVTAPSGFSLLGSQTFSDNSWIRYVYWKLAGGAEPGTYTVGFNSSVFSDLDMVAVQGGGSAAPLYIGNNGNSTSASVTGLTVPASGSLLWFGTVSGVGTRSSGPTGGGGSAWANRETYDTNVYVDTSDTVPSGATGTVATTYTSQIWTAQLVSVSPPVAANPPPRRRPLPETPDEVLTSYHPTDVAAIAAPAPTPPSTVLRVTHVPLLDSDDWVTPRRTMIAAVIAVAAATTAQPRPLPRQSLDVEEQAFPRPRPGMAPLLPPPPFITRAPELVTLEADPQDPPPRRRQMAPLLPAPPFISRAPEPVTLDVDPWDPPPRRRLIAAVAPAAPVVNTVLRPPARPWLTDDETIPGHRVGIAAILAPAPAAPDTVLRPPGRSAPEDPEYLPQYRPDIAAVLPAPVVNTVLRPIPRPALIDDEVLPGRRLGIAGAIYAPDTILRPARPEVIPDPEPEAPARRLPIAAILAPRVDTVLRPLPRLVLFEEEVLQPERGEGIAGAIAAPDTILRGARPAALPESDPEPPARRAAVAAIAAPPPAAPGMVSRPNPRPPVPPEDDPPWMRRPPVAAITAPPPAAPSTVLKPLRMVPAADSDETAPGRRQGVAAVIALGPPPAQVLVAPRARAVAAEDEAAPFERPQIAAVLAVPSATLVPRGLRAVLDADLDSPLPSRRPQIAALLAPPPAPPDNPPPTRRRYAAELWSEPEQTAPSSTRANATTGGPPRLPPPTMKPGTAITRVLLSSQATTADIDEQITRAPSLE